MKHLICSALLCALPCAALAAPAPAAAPEGYLDTAFGWLPRAWEAARQPAALRQLGARHQQASRVAGVPTPQAVLEQSARQHRPMGNGSWTFFPAAPPQFMPYLDGLFVPGNTCIEPGAPVADDPLSSAAQAAKAAASHLGLQYTLTLSANYTGLAPRPSGRRSDFMAFNNQISGSWFLAKSADNQRGVFLSFEADWGQGVNYNERRQSAQQSLGSLSNPQGSNRGGKGVFIPNLALGYSHAGGKWVSLVGTIDMSNFLDQNAYSGNWSGNLTNESFNYNPALPMQWANWGYLTAFQPSKDWYLLYAASGCETQVNQNPFSDISDNAWVHMTELGLIRDDAFGLGPGTYRLLGTLTRKDGSSGCGVAANIQQQLGRNSRVGFFSRAGLNDSSCAALTGVKATATAGLVLQAPFSSSGWGSSANNDQIALGFLWERAAESEKPYAHKDEYGLELSAVVQITPTFFLQPDVQYIMNPIHSTDDDGAMVFQLQGVFRF